MNLVHQIYSTQPRNTTVHDGIRADRNGRRRHGSEAIETIVRDERNAARVRMATIEAMLDGLVDRESDEDWRSSGLVKMDSRMEGLKVSDARGGDAAGEASFEGQMLRVSMELTEVIRAVVVFTMEDHDATQSDEYIGQKELELSERFRRLRQAQLRLRCGRFGTRTSKGKARTESGALLEVLLAVDKQVRSTMRDWKVYCGKWSTLVEHDIYPWRSIGVEGEEEEEEEDVVETQPESDEKVVT
jgi:hypothetical protein